MIGSSNPTVHRSAYGTFAGSIKRSRSGTAVDWPLPDFGACPSKAFADRIDPSILRGELGGNAEGL
jgi:hypothetical protein